VLIVGPQWQQATGGRPVADSCAPTIGENAVAGEALSVYPTALIPHSVVPPHDVVPDAVISRLTELPAHLDKWQESGHRAEPDIGMGV
jgi:hypothetical protein